jgi:hypothetical protein
MDLKYIFTGKAKVFQLSRQDINIMSENTHITSNSLSLFKTEKGKYGNTLSKNGNTFIKENNYIAILNILLIPDFHFKQNIAGKCIDHYSVNTFLKNTSQDMVCVIEGSEGFTILCFNKPEDYVLWFINFFTMNTKTEYGPLFDQEVSLNTILMTLHCIDMYSRGFYESMLSYNLDTGVTMLKDDFELSYAVALKSRDIRWLAPSLFYLTPSLSTTQEKLSVGNLNILKEKDLIKLWKNEKDDELITITEKAQEIGYEFCHNWIQSIGISAVALVNDKKRLLSRIYLAPTAYTNHLFSFKMSQKKEFMCNYQTLTREKLTKNFTQWIKAVVNTCLEKNICPSCKKIINEDSVFCIYCGAKLKK